MRSLSLGALLRLGRALARRPHFRGTATLHRVEGGLVLRATGVTLALLRDRLRILHWTGSRQDFRETVGSVFQATGVSLRLEDARRSATPAPRLTAAAHGYAPQPEAPPTEPAQERPPEDEPHEAPSSSAPEEDDFGPGL